MRLEQLKPSFSNLTYEQQCSLINSIRESRIKKTQRKTGGKRTSKKEQKIITSPEVLEVILRECKRYGIDVSALNRMTPRQLAVNQVKL